MKPDSITGGYRPLHGFYTLFYKEWLRFWKVSVQTVLAPVLTALLFLLVFSHSLRGHVEAFPGVEYTAFLIPGLAMMSVLQNAFANSSSSLMQSKMTGNIVFVLLPPLSHGEFFSAYLLAAVARGLVVGCGVFAAAVWFVDLPLEHPLWAFLFALFGSGIMGALGIIAGIYSDKETRRHNCEAQRRPHVGMPEKTVTKAVDHVENRVEMRQPLPERRQRLQRIEYTG